MKLIDVLIIDNDVCTAEIHAQFLRQTPRFKPVGIASNLDIARSMIRIYKPKLIILDFNFSDGSGMDLLRGIMLDNSELKPSIIFTTSSCQIDMVTTAINFGCFDYLLKPVSFERLTDTLYRYLKYNSIINAYDNISQFNIDRIFNVFSRYKSYKMLPKGINEITLEKIKRVFNESNKVSYTADTLSSYLGISKTTSRRYLEYCSANGFLYAKNCHGNIGRPVTIYCKND